MKVLTSGLFAVGLIAYFVLFSCGYLMSAPVTFSDQERPLLMQMCESARWASRAVFDQVCEQLKAKFSEADKAAEEAAKKPEEKK